MAETPKQDQVPAAVAPVEPAPGWLWTILIVLLLAIGIVGTIGAVGDKITFGSKATSSRPKNALPAGDEYIKVAHNDTWVVMPDGEWTITLMRQYNAPGFWAEPDGRIDMIWIFANSEEDTLIDFEPTEEIVDERKCTGIRFRNTGDAPVHVKITSFY